MSRTTLQLDYPVSTNRLWRRYGGRTVMSQEARQWKRAAGWLAKAHWREPMTGDIRVDVTLHPRKTKTGGASKTRIDLDNALKAALDALQGHAYQDDHQVVQVTAKVGPAMPSGGLTVTVRAA